MKPETTPTRKAVHRGRKERYPPAPRRNFLRGVLWVTNDFRGRTYLSLLSPRRHWCYISGKAADVSGQLDLLWRKALVAVGNPADRP